MKRGAVTKADSKLIPIWAPVPLIDGLDKGVKVTDLDRSKFIRAAIREKLANCGIVITSDLQ
jgi:hypothetical protein